MQLLTLPAKPVLFSPVLLEEDITNYLESKQDHEVIGELSSSGCLGANALNHKYPQYKFIILYGNIGFTWRKHDECFLLADVFSVHYVPIHPSVIRKLDEFDFLALDLKRPVTKREFLLR